MSDYEEVVVLLLGQDTPKVKRNLRFRISSKNMIFPGYKLLEGSDYFSWNFIPSTASDKEFCREFKLKNTWWMNGWFHGWVIWLCNIWLWAHTNVGWMKTQNVNEHTSTWHTLAFVNKGMNRMFVPSILRAQQSHWQGFREQRWHSRALPY